LSFVVKKKEWLFACSKTETLWKRFFLFILLATLIAPNFPTLIGNEIYINVAYVIIGIFFLMIRRHPISRGEVLLVIFYFCMQIILLCSWTQDIFYGNARVSDLGSALRPMLLALTPMTFVYLLYKQGAHPVDFLDIFFKYSLVILSLFFVVDRMGITDSLKSILWVSDRLMPYDYFLSFFGTTYFAAYFYFMCYLYFLVAFFHRLRFTDGIFFMMAIVFLVFAQSKTFYFLFIITIPLAWAMRSGVVARIILVIVTLASGIVLKIYLNVIVSIFLEGELLGLRSFGRLLNDVEGHGSFSHRFEQAYNAAVLSIENFGFGVGLGREEMLESYIAAFIYRYGLIGFILYSFFFIIVAFFSYSNYKLSGVIKDKIIFLFCSIWYTILPIAMLSNPMYEMGKNAIFSSLVLAALIYCVGFQRYKNMRFNSIKA